MVAVMSNGDGDDDEENEERDADAGDGNDDGSGENAEVWAEVDGISKGRCVGSGGRMRLKNSAAEF